MNYLEKLLGFLPCLSQAWQKSKFFVFKFSGFVIRQYPSKYTLNFALFFQTVALNFALFMRQCDFRKNYRSFEIFGGSVCFVGILIVPKKKETDFGG